MAWSASCKNRNFRFKCGQKLLATILQPLSVQVRKHQQPCTVLRVELSLQPGSLGLHCQVTTFMILGTTTQRHGCPNEKIAISLSLSMLVYAQWSLCINLLNMSNDVKIALSVLFLQNLQFL